MSARRRFIGRPSARLSRRTLLAAGLVAAAALGVISLSGPAVPVGGPFSLVDGAGRRWTDADFRGRYLLVYFGYTFCPDVCPTALGELSAALGRLPPGMVNELRVIFISVDPERDTGTRLAEYGPAFHESIMGLTGTREEIDRAAAAFGARYRITGEAGGGAYSIDHTSIIYVMDRDGRFVTQFTHKATPEQMTAKLARIIR